VGLYEIVAPLGAGGMGEVYRAKDTKLKRVVALKVLPENFASDPERMARFQREAEVLASLNHQNIAQIYGVEDRALVMELVEGESPKGPMPFDEAWKVASQIAAGLEYAHEKGIVHRDLKPANIKITPDGVVKLLDFGLAKAFTTPAAVSGNPENSPTLTLGATQLGVILGTAAYMSPEQAKGKAVDKRADIWSFGVVLYELLTGERLFTGDDVSDTLAQVLTKQPEFDRAPMPCQRVLRQCLEKDPRLRLRDIGDVRCLLDELTASSSGAPHVPSPARRFSSAGWLASAFLVLAGVALWDPWHAAPTDPPLMRLEITIPEKENLGLFVLSPDGRRLAFWSAGSDGVTRIWIRPLESTEARPLAGTESVFGSVAPTPFWSSDSRFLAFYSDGKLKKIEVFGGPAQTVCNFPSTVVGGSWNTDGVIVFGTIGPIMRVSAAGGVPVPVTTLDSARSEIRHLLPVFLPDGRHFLYLRMSSAAENSGIYMGSLDAPPAQQSAKVLAATTIGPAYFHSPQSSFGQMLFLRDGTLLAQRFNERRSELEGEPVVVADQVGSLINGGFFSGSSSGVLVYRRGSATFRNLRLTWMDLQGKPAGTVWEPAPYASPALAPDGRRAAVSRLKSQGAGRDLWLIDFTRGAGARFTFEGNTGAVNPVWSSDGSHIVFTSNRNGVNDLYLKASNNARNEEILLKSGQNKIPTSWSRDGRFLLYTLIDAKTKNDIWVVPIPSGTQKDQKPVPFLATEFNEREGQFSPDGRWVAYVSDESGRDEVYVREFSSASDRGKWLVSNGGGVNPRWRPDGRALLYSAPDGGVLTVDLGNSAILQPGSPRLLFKLPLGSGAWDLSPDGKRFLVPIPAEESSRTPFTVVLNWRAGLKN
jgi:serine/threonine protein kinase